jgi:hypothetical protein
MDLEDVDRKGRFITERLKGARDQHRVPVTDSFCCRRTSRRISKTPEPISVALPYKDAAKSDSSSLPSPLTV